MRMTLRLAEKGFHKQRYKVGTTMRLAAAVAAAAATKSLQLCLTLCDPIDHSSPGSSVHGIFQARELEWVAIDFSEWGW